MHDFEARITRRPDAVPIKAGWREGITYPDDLAHSYLVFPVEFFDEAGHPYAHGAELPDTFFVNMVSLDHEFRTTIHRNKIKLGTTFLMREGRRVRADGVVTKITGLFEEP